ncbi:hypothetical protein Tsubulata_007396, partial [Turnera subulata]
MILKSLPLVIFPLLLICQLSKAAAPIARPNCQDRCGNISIPYPFGIGNGCYLNKSFEIVCNQTSNSPPRAYISSINMELLDIVGGTAFVKGPVIPFNCSGKGASPTSLNFTGSPFFFSFDSCFISVGCNIRSLLNGIGPTIIGCQSTCSNQSYVPDGKPYKFCSGRNCCQVDVMPYELQVFIPHLENLEQDSSGCKVAYMADPTYREVSNVTDDPQVVKDLEYVPMGLAWIMDDAHWKYDIRVMS